MNFINAATKKERTHVEEIIKSQPVMPHEGITATEIGICGKQNLFMDVYRPDNDAEKHPIITATRKFRTASAICRWRTSQTWQTATG